MKPPDAKPKPEPKKKSQAAERAVVKPKAEKEPPPDEAWKGGVDHFSERV